MKYKQIYQCVYGTLFIKYFVSSVKHGVYIQPNFLFHFKEWTGQKISKQKSAFTSTEKRRGEDGFERNRKGNQIQESIPAKNSATFDQRQAPHFDFK